MALSAKFVADFSSFYDAVQKADVSLKGFDTSANKVNSSLARMTDQFSGRRLVQEATVMERAIEKLGGVSKLTDGEMRRLTQTIGAAADKMKAMGGGGEGVAAFQKAISASNTQTADSFRKLFTNVEKTSTATNQAGEQFRALFTAAPKQVKQLDDAIGPMPGGFDSITSAVRGAGGALGLAFSGASILKAIVDQTAAALAYADQLTNLAASTSISIQGLQRLEAIGRPAGVSMQELASAVNTLQLRLDDPKALDAIRRMGLNFADIQRLRPEDQFLQLATAVSRIEDPIQKANAGAALFKGAWTSIAPAITKDMDSLVKSTQTFSDAQIKAGADASREWSDFFSGFNRGVRGFILDIYAGDKAMNEAGWLGRNKAPTGPALPTVPSAPTGPKIGGVATVTSFVDPSIIKDLKVGGETLDQQTRSVEKNAAAQAAWREIADRTHTATVALTAAQLKQIDVWTKAGVSASTAATALGVNERAVANYMEGQRDLAKVIPVTNAAVAKFEDLVSHSAIQSGLRQINRDTEALTGTLAQFTTSMRKSAVMFPDWTESIDKLRFTLGSGGNFPDWSEETLPMLTRFGSNLDQFFSKDFGQIVVQGITGGGNAIKGALTGLGNTLFAKEGAFGGAIGKGVEGLFGKSGMVGKIGGMIGGMVPIIGSFIGPAIEGVTKLFTKVFGKSEETKSVSPLRDEFFKLQGGLETLNPRVQALGGNLSLVQAVFDAKTVVQYNAAIAELNGLFQQEQDALALLTETAARYGFTIEELGPAMARQQLDKQAQQLFKDWEVLNAAGIDTVAITSRMAEGVNAYVHDALKMGTEVPEAMRPMLTQMAEMGQLTDANGNKIGSLEDSALTFSMTMSEGFTKLIAEVQKLADVLTRSLGGAVAETQRQIENFPTTIPIEVEYTTSGAAPKGATASVPGYQGGTHGKFVDFGAGSLVMLHGKEAVVPEDQTGGTELAARARSGGGGADGAGITVHIDARGALFNEPGSDQRLAALVERALSARHGLTHKRRAA